jgi:hypothetical protein
MIRSRVQLPLVAAGLVASVVSGSTNVVSPPAGAKLFSIDESADDSYKTNQDWWRDPFAAFDESKEFDDPEEGGEQRPGTAERTPAEAEEGVPDSSTALVRPDDPVVMSDTEINQALIDGRDEDADRTKELPKDVKDRLAARSMIPVERKASGFSAPLALLLPAMPKVRQLASRLPIVKAIATLAVLKALYDQVLNGFVGIRHQTIGTHEAEVGDAQRADTASNDRYEPEPTEEDEDYEEPKPKREKRVQSKPADVTELHEVKVTPKWFTNIFGGNSSHEKLPSARELMYRVKELQGAAEKAVSDRDTIELEYEKASWQVRTTLLILVLAMCDQQRSSFNHQSLVSLLLLAQLQEAQTELSTLTSTTRYLKTQLRDNEEVMDRAIKAERLRAKKELTRMKEAMLSVLERERKAMRAELMRQTAEVKAMLQAEEPAEI